jgi:hypothetical protein
MGQGGGLYSSLLLRIRHLLGMHGINDFIIDADEGNLRSLRGMHKAGFRPLATVSFITLFKLGASPARWCRSRPPIRL